MATYHGLPLATFLHDKTTALLDEITGGALAPAMAAKEGSLVTSRSDALIIAETPGDPAGRRRRSAYGEPASLPRTRCCCPGWARTAPYGWCSPARRDI